MKCVIDTSPSVIDKCSESYLPNRIGTLKYGYLIKKINNILFIYETSPAGFNGAEHFWGDTSIMHRIYNILKRWHDKYLYPS